MGNVPPGAEGLATGAKPSSLKHGGAFRGQTGASAPSGRSATSVGGTLDGAGGADALEPGGTTANSKPRLPDPPPRGASPGASPSGGGGSVGGGSAHGSPSKSPSGGLAGGAAGGPGAFCPLPAEGDGGTWVDPGPRPPSPPRPGAGASNASGGSVGAGSSETPCAAWPIPLHSPPWTGMSCAGGPQPPWLLPPGGMQTRASAEAELQRKAAQILSLSRQIEASQAELRQLQGMAAAQPPPVPIALPLTEGVRHLAGACRADLDGAREKLKKSLKVATNLQAWFVENAATLHIQDPSRTPTAFLESLLEVCDSRTEQLGNDLLKLEGGLDAAFAAHQHVSTAAATAAAVANAAPSGQQAQVQMSPQAQVHPQPQVPAHMQAQPNAYGVVAHAGPHMQLNVMAHGATHGAAHGVHGPWHAASSPAGLTPAGVPGTCPGPTPAAATPGGFGVEGMWVRDPDAVQ